MRKRAASYRSAQTSIKHGDEAIIFRQNIVTTPVWWRGVSYLKSLFTKHFSLYFHARIRKTKKSFGRKKKESLLELTHFQIFGSPFSLGLL